MHIVAYCSHLKPGGISTEALWFPGHIPFSALASFRLITRQSILSILTVKTEEIEISKKKKNKNKKKEKKVKDRLTRGVLRPVESYPKS